jgi:hypothetical protein
MHQTFPILFLNSQLFLKYRLDRFLEDVEDVCREINFPREVFESTRPLKQQIRITQLAQRMYLTAWNRRLELLQTNESFQQFSKKNLRLIMDFSWYLFLLFKGKCS